MKDNNWEEEFDEMFAHKLHIATHNKENYSGLDIQVDGEWEKIKSFISKKLKEQRERIIEELTGCFTDRQFVFTLPQDGFGELMEVKILDFGGVNAYARIENGIERVNDIIINKLKQ
jgi:hypothetical protein